jgi:bifunctional ADP-heptose synthase (sugar kinase/adenylyltransferase)
MFKTKILLIGESCKDRFIYGDCTRLNPEAPTPVFIPKKEVINGGMVLNVEENLKSLGVTPTVITNNNVCVKTRYVDENSNYILLRIDEDIDYRPLTIEDCGDIESYDVVIISDYNKGLITSELIKDISLRSKLLFIDTKKKLSDWVKDVTFIKLNKNEYLNNKEYVDNFLINKTVITMGGDGCMLGNTMVKTKNVEVRDVVGAGDTFLASVTIDFLRNGFDIFKAMEFANKCATYVVKHKGVTTPNLNKI